MMNSAERVWFHCKGSDKGAVQVTHNLMNNVVSHLLKALDLRHLFLYVPIVVHEINEEFGDFVQVVGAALEQTKKPILSWEEG